MKCISRIDQVRDDNKGTHCWIVRIMIGSPYQIYKTFTDGLYKNKAHALKAAILFRDKMLRKFKKVMAAYREKQHQKLLGVANYDKMERLPAFRGKGYRERTNKSGTQVFFQAYIRDRYDDTRRHKNFSFTDAASKKKAEKGAIKWRAKQVKIVLAKAQDLGIPL